MLLIVQGIKDRVLNIGEELVASYLEHIKGCDFIQKNLYTPDVQGEIDVVGINLKERKVYICEVAIHLATGLRYVKDRRPNNAQKLTEKFSRDIEYANKYFPHYERHIMLWSPIIKGSRENSKYSQEKDIAKIRANIKAKYGFDIEFVINERFLDCFNELRKFARTKTEELKNPVLRLLQIEESLLKHVGAKG
ncbi:hypothetical protein R2083_02740 [Nitrosomonas sp. Is35]|uniref:hypothetical protein n=1 Tax=unclassified Nitrosomonas TaxID=2609265 RepID=UPI00294AE5F3|nr:MULTISPECIES: hypothetical protein [unclassified Nitrosomonas]MDV6340671.1 hypothetical protein [Nitrosomonas sp. Is24]MDV6346430.1 hypothetical protein [Nitrosomonas sp. Is35]